MPVDRATARKNLLSLLAYQATHEGDYGELLLAVWYDIEDPLEDLHLFEVYEAFLGPNGEEVGAYRFPGMGYLWLPGLYHVSVCSRAAFERAVAGGDPDITSLRDALRAGRAEVIFASQPTGVALAHFITDELTS